MSGQDVPAVLAGLACFALVLALAWLTARQTAGLDRVPMHFGLDLTPDSFGPRWVSFVLIPVGHAAMLAFPLVVPKLHLPTHGDVQRGLWVGHLVTGLAFGCAQGVLLVLIRRWRRGL